MKHLLNADSEAHCGAEVERDAPGRALNATLAARPAEGEIPWVLVCNGCVEVLDVLRARGGLGPIKRAPRGLTLEEERAYWLQHADAFTTTVSHDLQPPEEEQHEPPVNMA